MACKSPEAIAWVYGWHKETAEPEPGSVLLPSESSSVLAVNARVATGPRALPVCKTKVREPLDGESKCF